MENLDGSDTSRIGKQESKWSATLNVTEDPGGHDTLIFIYYMCMDKPYGGYVCARVVVITFSRLSINRV